jgi:hypothetical protein
MEELNDNAISFSMRNSNPNKEKPGETLIIIEENKRRTKCNENCDYYCCIVPCFICLSIICCCDSVVVISCNKNESSQLCPDLFPDYCPNFFCCCSCFSFCNKKDENPKQPSQL